MKLTRATLSITKNDLPRDEMTVMMNVSEISFGVMVVEKIYSKISTHIKE